MKKVLEAERCTETFDGHRCNLRQGHWGKHHCTDDFVSVAWTDAGKKRVLQERAGAEKTAAV
jgi:hypothetical protein